MKNYGFRNFHTFKNNLTTGFNQKNQPGCISTAVIRLYLMLNAAKSITFRSTANFKNLPVFRLPASQPASQPACLPTIRPGSARCMAPDFSHN